jgi:hypothetical protein
VHGIAPNGAQMGCNGGLGRNRTADASLLRNLFPQTRWDQVEPKRSSLFFQSSFGTFSEQDFLSGKYTFVVGLPSGQQAKDDAGQFMSGGHVGLRSSQASPHATIELAQVALTAVQ